MREKDAVELERKSLQKVNEQQAKLIETFSQTEKLLRQQAVSHKLFFFT